MTDLRVNGRDIQIKNRSIKVLDREDESDWITIHTGTLCQAQS